jgi:tetratricopeptide (TPR) repeat protein
MTHRKITDAIPSEDRETKMWKSRFSAAKAAYGSGEFRQCESLLYRAIEEAKGLRERTFALNTCHTGLGALYLASGKREQAREHLQKAMNALEGCSEAALEELYAVALRFYALVLAEEGDIPGAEDHLKKSMAILEDLGSDAAVQLAYTVSDLATLYAKEGNLKESKDLIFSSLSLMESALGPDNPAYARSCMIYNACDSTSEKELLDQVEDGIFKAQYQVGYKHPNITRALRWYLKKRQELGEMDKIEEAKVRFDLHAKAMGL